MRVLTINTNINNAVCSECGELISDGIAITLQRLNKDFFFCDIDCLKKWLTKKAKNNSNNTTYSLKSKSKV